jgi:hypothetical protein
MKIILDTDIGADCDDAGAISLLHGLCTLGEAEILGMVCNVTSPWGAPCLDAMNTWYGRPDIPVGTLKGPGSSGTTPDWWGDAYNRTIAEEYPNRIRHGSNAPDAVDLYRQLLAAAQDGEITIVSIGMLTVLRDLLRSGPDSISILSGKDLVRRAVRELSVMAARYPRGEPECNIVNDVPAAKMVFEQWPGFIMYNGSELGERVQTSVRLFQNAPKSHILRRAYELWNDHFASRWQPEFVPGSAFPHCSFDQISALYAVRGLREYWTAERNGNFHVFDDGSCEWRASAAENRACLQERMPPDALATIIEDLMLLCTPQQNSRV